MSQPNILLIITDQQRFDSLGCYGFEAAHTPNLDRLANQGLLFEHCYVNNPICTPSRASLMTGQHLPGHGVYQLYTCLTIRFYSQSTCNSWDIIQRCSGNCMSVVDIPRFTNDILAMVSTSMNGA